MSARAEFFTKSFDREIEQWVSQAAALGYTIEEAQGRWHVRQRGALIANCPLRSDAARIAYALAVTFGSTGRIK